MVNLRREGDFGWLEGVVSGEVDGEEEDPALVRTVRWSHDGGLQHRLVTSHVVTLVTCRDTCDTCDTCDTRDMANKTVQVKPVAGLISATL